MGDQHYAIVRPGIGATREELTDLKDKLWQVFRKVWEPVDGLWLVYDKDFANCEIEMGMDNVVAKLSGIVSDVTEIVWAWDHPRLNEQRDAACEEDRFPPRQRVWYIPGKVPS
jgi:hypothetical protein